MTDAEMMDLMTRCEALLSKTNDGPGSMRLAEVERERTERMADGRALCDRVEALEAALRDVLGNDCYHPENLPEGDERCRRARAVLEGEL